MTVNTGYGYYKDLSGNIIKKYVLPIGTHPDPGQGLTQVEVADQAALDAIIIWQPTPTPEEAFNVDQFCSDLLGAFATDANILPYYAIVKDMASFKNFAGIKSMALGLQTAGKLTSDEITALAVVLNNQGIVWDDL